MTVEYEITGSVEHLTAAEVDKLLSDLHGSQYDWTLDGTELEVSGSCEVDDYSTDAADVADEIKWWLRTAYDIDADGSATEVESEPDWDKMPGGYDYLYN